MSGWLDATPMPPCPECSAEVETYTTERKLAGHYADGSMVYGNPRISLNPCGHEVEGYVVTVKWTPISV